MRVIRCVLMRLRAWSGVVRRPQARPLDVYQRSGVWRDLDEEERCPPAHAQPPRWIDRGGAGRRTRDLRRFK